MTIYNILFPFLILVALGIAIFILTKHLPEAVDQHSISEKEEKKRWWQVLLGKGENLLRSLRVLILRLDNKLSDSIKKVREKKERMGEGLREYRIRHKQKESQETSLAEKNAMSDHLVETRMSRDTVTAEEIESEEIPKQKSKEELFTSPEKEQTPHSKNLKKGLTGIAKKMSSVFRSSQEKPFASPKNKTVEEILKKTFTPTEIKVEKEQYWKKKEEMLIQSIVREPKNIGLYLQLGRLYSNQHNWKDARNAFLEVLKLDKTNIKAKEELRRIDKNMNE